IRIVTALLVPAPVSSLEITMWLLAAGACVVVVRILRSKLLDVPFLIRVTCVPVAEQTARRKYTSVPLGAAVPVNLKNCHPLPAALMSATLTTTLASRVPGDVLFF